MKKFISGIGVFIGYSFLLSICCVVFYIVYYKLNTDDIPAPNLSDSYSYNEKMEFLHKRKVNADILAVGSSMTLNNLNSGIITERLNSDSYLNTASWGMSMKDDFLLLKILADLHTPKMVIICSSMIDFQENDKKIKYPLIKHYLSSPQINRGNLLLETFNLKYYVTNFKYAKKVRSGKNEYESLDFDKYGAVNFDSRNFEISPLRWNQYTSVNNKTIDFQYSFLDSISKFCKIKDIKLLFFQSPVRNGLYSKLNKTETDKLQSHINRIEKILQKDNHSFVNANSDKWGDHLFVDGIHFNTAGTILFTQYCFDKIKDMNPQQPSDKKQVDKLR